MSQIDHIRTRYHHVLWLICFFSLFPNTCFLFMKHFEIVCLKKYINKSLVTYLQVDSSGCTGLHLALHCTSKCVLIDLSDWISHPGSVCKQALMAFPLAKSKFVPVFVDRIEKFQMTISWPPPYKQALCTHSTPSWALQNFIS